MTISPATAAKLPFVTAINGQVVGHDRSFFEYIGPNAVHAAESLTKRAIDIANNGGLVACLDAKAPRFTVRILSTITLQLPTAASAERECQRVNTAFRLWLADLADVV